MSKIRHTIAVDFESYFDTQCSLTKLSVPEYLAHSKFSLISVAVKLDNEPTELYWGAARILAGLAGKPWDRALCIAHNAQFDGAILERLLSIHPRAYFCTQMASRVFVAPFTRSASLRATAKFLGMEKKLDALGSMKGKYLEELTHEDRQAIGEYNIRDTDLTMKIARQFLPLLPAEELRLIDLTVKKFIRPKLRLDLPFVTTELAKHNIKRHKVIADSGLTETALRSNPQFAEALRSHGITPPMKTSPTTGKQTFAFAKTDNAFTGLLAHSPEVKKLVAARLIAKSSITGTRLVRMVNVGHSMNKMGGLNIRVHPLLFSTPELPIPLAYYGAHTGRFSGSDKMNMQNLTKGSPLRKMVLPYEGHKLITADLKQIEARIVAWMAGEATLLHAFRTGEDIYSEFAKEVYGYDIDPVVNIKERFVGKTCILGLGYGMGHKKLFTQLLGANVFTTEAECERMVALYRTRFNGIVSLWQLANALLRLAANTKQDRRLITTWNGILTMEIAHTNGVRALVVKLANGMPITYPNIRLVTGTPNGAQLVYGPKGSKPTKIYGAMFIENIVQALARGVIASAEIRLHKAGYTSSMQVHDELVFTVPNARVHDGCLAIKAEIERQPAWLSAKVLERYGEIPIEAELGVGDNYLEAK